MDTKYSEEAFDVFYLEIEERIMLVISDDEDEQVMAARVKRAPLVSINGNQTANFLPKSSFFDVNWYGGFDMGMKQSAWPQYGATKAKPRRLPAASGRRGTGVFIPRCAAVERK
ncbi:hypothetical protein KSP39_PZI020593 [Platanthera zijinensis]|uniref:Uncharacterized protein n=1 Tax=Platanthera zijinensis TaxID=2320716 RepID=A0AAP0AZW0_9ASPA